MATMTLTVTSGNPSYCSGTRYLEVTYTKGNGYITVTEIKGYNTLNQGWQGNMYYAAANATHTFKIGSKSTTFTSYAGGSSSGNGCGLGGDKNSPGTAVAWKWNIGNGFTIKDDAGFSGTMSITVSSEFSVNMLSGYTFTSSASETISPTTYTVSYNANGGSGAPGPQTKTAGVALTLSNAIPTKNSTTQNGYTVSFNSNGGSSVSAKTATDTVSYQFANWNTNSAGTGTTYGKGAPYTVNESVTLYAQYNSTISRGSISLPTPTRANYTFAGWSDGSKTYTGSYTPSSNVTLTAVWNINPPQNFAIDFIDNTETSVELALSVGSGIVDSTILYYREKGKATWSQATGSLSDLVVIENLLPDTNYEFGMSATNSGHTRYYGNTTSLSSMTYETYSTDMTLPGTPGVGTVEITPFTVTLAGSCYSDPERDFMWSFSKDNGETWTEYQTSNQYTFTGLSEETSYNFGIKAYPIVEGVNASGQSKAGYRTITTPADQARARIKVNGKWETSKMYIKENGEWKKIKKMYIKKDGLWVRASN